MGQDLPGPCEAVTAPHPPSPCAFPPIAISSPGAELAPSPLRSNSWGLRGCSPNPSTRRVRAAASTGKHRAQAALKRQAPCLPQEVAGASALPGVCPRSGIGWRLLGDWTDDHRGSPHCPGLHRVTQGCGPGTHRLGFQQNSEPHPRVASVVTPQWGSRPPTTGTLPLAQSPASHPHLGPRAAPNPYSPGRQPSPIPWPDSKYQRNLRQT